MYSFVQPQDRRMQADKSPPQGDAAWKWRRPICSGQNLYLYCTQCFLKGRKKVAIPLLYRTVWVICCKIVC